MKITMGLFDNMVLQRDRRNRSRAYFKGEADRDGALFVRVGARGKTMKGFERIKAGRVRQNKLAGLLKGLPAGGPYDIEISIEDAPGQIAERRRIRNVLVGDVWILGGQSNMEGIGYLKYAARPNSNVRAFYMDDRWATARDPIHNLSKAVDQVHADLNGGTPPLRAPQIGVGPGVAFGQEMQKRTGVPQGLIACAHGGTSMSQWDPALKTKGSRSLYGAMLRRFRKNGGRIAGVVWYQGCSDANAEHIHYTRRMTTLVKNMRRDFGAARLPVVMAQIAGVYSSDFNPDFWNSVQEQQRRLPEKIKYLQVAPAIDLSFDDIIHISGADQNRLGQRLAQAMRVLKHDRQAGRPPPGLSEIIRATDKISGLQTIYVKFRNVMGRLQAAGRPCGFSVIQKNAGAAPVIFRVDLEGATAILRTNLPPGRQPLAVAYGHGLAPYCNITDAADRSLPVFGPVRVTTSAETGRPAW